MDNGETVHRQQFSPMPIFSGTLELRPHEFSMLEAFCRSCQGKHFSFPDPQTGETVYSSFIRFANRGRRSFMGSSDAEWTTVSVEIVLRDNTRLIEKALKHGSVTLD